MVASTPASSKFSGWPAHGLPSWRKLLDVVDRRPRVAGQVEQGVDQHRAVAGRQDEAVAVGPVRIGRVELQMPVNKRGRGVGHAHRHARMAAVGGLDRIHRQGANGVGEAALGRLHRGSAMGFGAPQDLGPMARALCQVSRAASTLARDSRKLRSGQRMDDGGLSTSPGPRRARAAADRARARRARSRRPAATRSCAPRCAKWSPSSTS